MTNSGNNNTLARIVFALAVVVFLVAVGWTVNSAVKAYELHRGRVAARAEARAEARTEAKARTDAEMAPRPVPPGDSTPEAATKADEQSIQERFEAERRQLEAKLEAARQEAFSADEPAADAPDADAPVRAGGSVTPPAKIGGPDPKYTAEALAERTQGIVVIEAIIERDGTVSSTRVLHGLSTSLDEQARSAVAQWRFEPATRDGQPVRAIYTATIDFRLR